MSEHVPELKMWLAVRDDLGMSSGKLAVQSGHAFGWLHIEAMRKKPGLMVRYLETGTPKIAVRVPATDEGSEQQLIRVFQEARAADICAYMVRDAGRSELEPGTLTVCAFGPYLREDLPPFLKRLRLL